MRVALDIQETSPPAESRAGDSSSDPRKADSGALLWMALAGLFLLAAACWPMQQHTLPIWAQLCLIAGVVAWLVVVSRIPGLRERLGPLAPASKFSSRLGVGLPLSIGLTVLSWRLTRNGELSAGGVACWLSAILLWFVAWWPGRSAEPARPTQPPPVRRLWIAAALLLILVIGAFFRFHRLSEIPPQPGSDHAEDLLNIVDLDQGERPVFFPRNTGQPPLPFYWEFFLHRVTGLPINYLDLKISTALIGMLAIPAIYWLGAELGGPALGLAAAALCAWAKWPTLGARRGLTFPWAVFPAALALWAILRYMRRGDRASALWAGFWIGLGQFGYNAFKIIPGLVPIAVVLSLFDSRWKGRRWRLIGGGALITATALLVFLPLLQYMVERPQDFWYRAMTRAGTKERPLPGPAPVIFASNLKRMALAFHWEGDNAWVNTPSGEPFLDPVTGALLLAGTAMAAVSALRGSRRWTLILVSLFVLTLASTLALAFPIENPAINRAAVAMPSVLVLAALPAVWIWEESRKRKLPARVAVVVGAPDPRGGLHPRELPELLHSFRQGELVGPRAGHGHGPRHG